MAFLSLKATVTLADGTEHRLTTNSYDLYRAEEFRDGLTLSDHPKVGDMFAIVWSAARRAGIAGDDFEAWLAEVELDLDADESEGTDSSPTGSGNS